ncbi:MAG: FkbM family methyltransferase [Verrucomicrobiota bacterium]
MSGIYHSRGFWWGMIRQPAWHLREWARSPAYRALHRFARQLRNQPRFTPATVVFANRRVHLCDPASFLSAWDEIFVNRIYEIALDEGKVPCLVDAGANIGLAALFWKWRYGRFRYLGIEPDPAVAACCRRNLQEWDVDGELIESAVAGTEGRAWFAPDGADGGRLLAAAPAGVRAISVTRTCLSRLLPERVDLLKIDVEGAEGEVLIEIAPALPRVRALFVEWHGGAHRRGLGAAITRLEAAGFDCFVQVAQGPTHPFLAVRPANGFDQQLNLYAVRP